MKKRMRNVLAKGLIFILMLNLSIGFSVLTQSKKSHAADYYSYTYTINTVETGYFIAGVSDMYTIYNVPKTKLQKFRVGVISYTGGVNYFVYSEDNSAEPIVARFDSAYLEDHYFRDAYAVIGFMSSRSGSYEFFVAAYYKILFDANGGTNCESMEKTYGSSMELLPSTHRTGYTFTGWYTAKTGGQKISKDTVITADTTFYAHWLVNKSQANKNDAKKLKSSSTPTAAR